MYNCNTLITTGSESAGSEKKLSICLTADGFSFAVTTPDATLLTFGEAAGPHPDSITDGIAWIKEVLAHAGIRPLAIDSSELVVVSDYSAWVPDELYTSTSNRQYLKLVGGEAQSIVTCHDDELASTCVFAANEQTVTAFKVAVPGIVVRSQHAKMACLAKRSADHPMLAVGWRGGKIDVAAFRDGRYLFGNTIDCGSDEEVRFRVIEVSKTFNIESPSTELLLFGDVDRERFVALRPYFPKTTLFSGDATRFLNPEFKKLHTYRHALILF